MALGKAVFPQEGEYLLGQTKEPQLVGHRRLGFSHFGGRLLLGQAIDGDEPLQRLGLLPEIQVTPLKILNQGEQTGALPRDLQDQTGNLFQAADHGGPQPALPGNELIAPTALAPDGKGLENSMDTNALCQLSEPVRVKVSAGLVGVGRNIIRRYHGHPGAFHQPSSI